MNKEDHMRLMREMFSKSEEEINEMFNSGVFNDIVKGYAVMMLRQCGLDEKIKECLVELNHAFDELTSGEARRYLEMM